MLPRWIGLREIKEVCFTVFDQKTGQPGVNVKFVIKCDAVRWATFVGDTSPNTGVATACAEQLAKPKT